MGRSTTALMKAGLSALYYSGAGGAFAPLTRGAGVIFMMHRVSPEPIQEFEPNRILRITPEFLDAVVQRVKDQGFEIVAVGDIPERLESRQGRPFACFTFDDGYRDNIQYAFPVMRRHGAPYTLYVPTDYPDGRGDLWWLVLEEAIRRLDRVPADIIARGTSLAAATELEKTRAFKKLYWPLRTMPEPAARRAVAAIAKAAGYDPAKLCADLIMSWDELRVAARDPLLTVGAHTCRHLAVAKLSEADARSEMEESRARIEAELGRPCEHFSFPYGCELAAGPRDFALASVLGFKTAVTTRKGVVTAGHARMPTALPRLSLNGDFQDLRYVDVMMSGLPFAMWNAARGASV